MIILINDKNELSHSPLWRTGGPAVVRIDVDDKFRFQLSMEDIALTSRLRFGWMINTDKEYMAGFRYILTKYVSLSSHSESDMGIGAALSITY